MVKFLFNVLAVLIASYLLPGVYLEGFWSALVLAVILGLLNITVKPLLLVLTIPATILTMGLFILVINAVIIMIADWLLNGFAVGGFWWALLFSLLLWLVNAFFKDVTGDNKKEA